MDDSYIDDIGDLDNIAEPTNLPAEPIDNDDSSEESNIGQSFEKQSLFDLLYGVISRPVITFKYISANVSWFVGALLYFLVSWITAVAGIPSQLDLIKTLAESIGTSSINFAVAFIVFMVLIVPFVLEIGLFLMSGVYHLLAKLLKGHGNYKGIIASLGFASFPSILIAPFNLLYFIEGSIGKIIAVTVVLGISFGVGLWQTVLSVIAIRENYELSTARAVAVYLIPIALAIIISIIMVIVFFAILATSDPKLLN